MEELKQSLAGIQSKIEALFSSISQELKRTESFLDKQSNGMAQPLTNLEQEFKTALTDSQSKSNKLLADLEQLSA